jgi:hypothetical protein
MTVQSLLTFSVVFLCLLFELSCSNNVRNPEKDISTKATYQKSVAVCSADLKVSILSAD